MVGAAGLAAQPGGPCRCDGSGSGISRGRIVHRVHCGIRAAIPRRVSQCEKYSGGVNLAHPDTLNLPDNLWQRPDMHVALAARDLGAVFRLVRQHTGTPQTRIAAATGLGQGRTNEVFNGRRRITGLDVIERCADGLNMPDHARLRLGIAPAGTTPGETRSQDAVSSEIRASARTAANVDLLIVRALGLIALNDSLMREPLTAPREHGTVNVRVLMLDPDSPAAAARAAEIGEAPAAFAAGIRMSLTRLEELTAVPHLQLEARTYRTQPVWRLIRVNDIWYVSVFADGVDGHRSGVHKVTGPSVLHTGFSRQFADLWAGGDRVI